MHFRFNQCLVQLDPIHARQFASDHDLMTSRQPVYQQPSETLLMCDPKFDPRFVSIELVQVADHNSPAFSGFVDWQSNAPLKCDVRSKQTFVESGEVSFATINEGSRNLVVLAFGQIFEWPQNTDTNSNSDSVTTASTLLAYYLRHGKLPQYFSGEFCAAIIDRNSGEVTLITDHTATRPLYYVVDNRGVAFSTDASCLLKHCRNPQDLDPVIVAYQLNGFHHLCPGRMLVREIMRVQPATILSLKSSGTTELEYWKPEDCPSIRYAREDEYYDHAAELLKKVIVERTPDSAAFGSHLSGGLDSTVITTVACDHRKHTGSPPPICYAWQPPVQPGETPTPDQHILALCEKFLGLQVQNIAPDEDTVNNYIDLDPAVHEYASDLLLELEVMKTAQNSNVTKILSGWGGDQVLSFSGRNPAASNPLRFYPHLFKKHFITSIEEKDSITVHPPKLGRFYGLRFDALRRRTRQTQISNIRSQVLSRRMAGWSVVGARHNLQYRYPLLDRRVLDFALGVPENLYYRNPHKRWLMRRTLAGIIPDEVRWFTDKSEPSRVNHSLQLLEKMSMVLSKELPKYDSTTNWRMGFIDKKALNASIGNSRAKDHSRRNNGHLHNISAFLIPGQM